MLAIQLFLLWNLNTIVYILLSGIGKNHIAVIGFACFGRVDILYFSCLI